MNLLAALSSAVLVYLTIGWRAGIRPKPRARTASAVGRHQAWLDRSGLSITSSSFVAISALAGLFGSGAVGVVTGSPALAVIAGVGSTVAPSRLLDTIVRRRDAERRACWPDALRDLTTRLRSGTSVHAALVDLARVGPVPLRPVFERYELLGGGLDHRLALEAIRTDLADPLSDRIVEVLLVAFDQGTRVVIDVLDDLAEAAVYDLRLSADISAARLETELEARGAAVLPFVVLGLLCLGSEGYRAFYASAAGSLVIIVGAALATLGLVLIGRLGRVDDEPRTIGPVVR